MPTFQVPTKEKRFIQPNKGEYFGNLFATWNIDFDIVKGYARVAPRARINTDSTDDAQLGVPTAFVRHIQSTATDRYWALCDTRLFRTAGTDPSAAFTEASSDDSGSTSPPTTMTAVSSDMIVYEDKLYVSLPTDIAELDGTAWDNDWWTTIPTGTAPTTGIAHPLHATKKTNTFLVGDGNLLHAMDKNENASNSRVILPEAFEIIWIRSNDLGTWIGARNKEGGEAECFFWDENAENYNKSYKLKGDRTFAGEFKDGVLYTVNGEGQLLFFNGSGFEEAAVFPIFDKINQRWQDGLTVDRCVHRNGMNVVDGKLHILVNSLVSGNVFLEEFPSGIWVFDEDEGLRHKYAMSVYDGTETDYGVRWADNFRSGALMATNETQGLFLAGATIRTDASTAITAIFHRDTNDSIVKRGFFITSIFESSAVEDVFQDLILSFKRFRSSSDSIVVKYRTIKNSTYPISPTPIQGTWSDTDTFTSTASALSNAVAGDEIEFVLGRGAGTTAHISSISEAGGTYTINLDETITNASGTFLCVVRDWIKCATISTQSIEYQEFDLDAFGSWIQLKVELRSASGSARAGDSPEFEMLKVRSQGEASI